MGGCQHLARVPHAADDPGGLLLSKLRRLRDRPDPRFPWLGLLR
uniref:Uncharacterized protein n=1 Tax=Arundo donax TaxID=35708 RepID=A0A0A8ZVB1_ARUDO